MTAETLKPFLSATATTNGYEKSTKFFKNHKNLLIFFITCILLMFCIVVSALQVPNLVNSLIYSLHCNSFFVCIKQFVCSRTNKKFQCDFKNL